MIYSSGGKKLLKTQQPSFKGIYRVSGSAAEMLRVKAMMDKRAGICFDDGPFQFANVRLKTTNQGERCVDLYATGKDANDLRKANVMGMCSTFKAGLIENEVRNHIDNLNSTPVVNAKDILETMGIRKHHWFNYVEGFITKIWG